MTDKQPIHRLAGQTLVYGMSTVIGRLLNYLLVPLYTRLFSPEQYGIVTELYAYLSFLAIVFTYGMETAFFRFFNREREPHRVYGTALVSIAITTSSLCLLLLVFSRPIAALLHYPDRLYLIVLCVLILGFDALCAIPFARLRQQNRALKFALLKIFNICTNIFFNIFFLIICPALAKSGAGGTAASLVNTLYNPDIGVGYVLVSNLIASVATLLLLSRDIFTARFTVSMDLWKRMIRYAWPMLIVGIAGMVNETIDRILLKILLPFDMNVRMALIGIYGACYKLSIIMTLFIQAFRMAAEPLFFEIRENRDAAQNYARILDYYMVSASTLFLFIALNLDIFKHFIGGNFHEGIGIVPVLLIANLFLGAFYNLSVWYKLTDKTLLGAAISIGGAILTLLLNIWWIPLLGYRGSAYATLACYMSMTVASYVMGKKHYPVPYHTSRILTALAIAVVVYLAYDRITGTVLILPAAGKIAAGLVIPAAYGITMLHLLRRSR